MAESDSATAFAAFREAVFDDFHLLLRLRSPVARDVYVAQVVAIGAARGFFFDEPVVWAALRAGEEAWLMQGADGV